jgi:hypothetical protein
MIKSYHLLVIFEILLIVTGAITLALTITLSSNLKSVSYTYFKNLAENWNTGTIKSVSTSKSLTCQNGEVPLINDHWPGTTQGCLTSVLRQGSCGKRGVKIPALESMPFYQWRGVSVCSVRNTESYLDLTVVETENSCPNGKKPCGVIDTLNHVLCIDSYKECPYNYMEVIPRGQPVPSGFNYTSTPLTGATLVLSNTNTRGKIISDFRISEDIPCADPDYKNYLYAPFFVEVFYSKNQCLTKIGEKVFDYDYELKDSESFWDLYNENGIIVYMNNLPSFANYSETLRNSGRQMRLYTKNYHGINSKCLEIIKNSNLSPRLLSDLIAMSNDSLDVSGLLTFSIIFGSIGVGWMCVYVFTYWVCLCCTECTKLFNFTRLFVSIFPSLFNFTMVVIACVIAGRFSSLGDSYLFLADNNCGDADMLSTIMLVKENSEYIISMIIPIMVFGFSNFLIFLCSFLICNMQD